ncbi:MAG TPA: biopolymer transporter ExbD, partial [Gemmatimonadaceae bacterium]|nr:biopolymer transporter ExbD [Gemmatimonadaceae bacterium]
DQDQVLGIDVNGQYYLNKKAIPNNTLGDRLKEIFENRTEDKLLYVKADKNLAYGKVLDAIDIASHNDVRVTGMITEQRPGTISAVQADNLFNAPAPAAGGKK